MRTQNTNNNRRQYGNRRNNQPQKPQKTIIEAALYVDNSISDEVYDQICDLFASAPFQQLSYPLSTPRYLVDDGVEDKTKLITVGYIQSYNAENSKFTVVIFNSSTEAITKYSDLVIAPTVIVRKDGTLGTVTKLNIIPMPEDDSEDEDEE